MSTAVMILIADSYQKSPDCTYASPDGNQGAPTCREREPPGSRAVRGSPAASAYTDAVGPSCKSISMACSAWKPKQAFPWGLARHSPLRLPDKANSSEWQITEFDLYLDSEGVVRKHGKRAFWKKETTLQGRVMCKIKYSAKSVLYAGCAAASMLFATTSHAFEGMYVGASLGFQDILSEEAFRGVQGDTVSANVGASGVSITGILGHHWTVSEGVLLGLEANLGSSSTNADYESDGLSGEFRANETYGVAGRLSLTLGHRGLVYGLLGAQATNFEIDESGQFSLGGNGSFSSDKDVAGVRVGIGTDLWMDDVFALRLEYSRTYYGEETFRSGGDRLVHEIEEALLNIATVYHF